MSKRLLLGFLILIIIGVIIYMVKDLFFSVKDQENPFDLKRPSLIKYDPSLVSHREIKTINLKMDEPDGIAINNDGDIIVAGTGVVIYDKFFKEKKSFYLNNEAYCVASGSSGKLFLGMEDHIEVYDNSGKFIEKWAVDNHESILTGIVATDDFVFVSDAGERLVHKYDLKGKLLGNIGKGDSSKGVPEIIIRSAFFDLALGREGELWITNPGNYLVEAFDVKGNFKSSWGKYSENIDGFSGCCNPTNISILGDGCFVTAEKAYPRVKIYSQEGKFMSIVAVPEDFDEGTKGLDLAIGKDDRIFVLDPYRKQIRIFEKK